MAGFPIYQLPSTFDLNGKKYAEFQTIFDTSDGGTDTAIPAVASKHIVVVGFVVTTEKTDFMFSFQDVSSGDYRFYSTHTGDNGSFRALERRVYIECDYESDLAIKNYGGDNGYGYIIYILRDP